MKRIFLIFKCALVGFLHEIEEQLHGNEHDIIQNNNNNNNNNNNVIPFFI